MSNIEVGIIFSGDSRGLDSTLNRSAKSIETYGRKATNTFIRIGRTLDAVSNRYLTRFNTLLGGAALTMAGRAIIEFDSRLARLAIQAGLNKKEMFALKEELFELAAATHQQPTELLAGLDAIVERTGNFKFAIGSLKQMGFVASATGAAMEDIGASASNLQEKMGIAENQVLAVFDILAEQGKKGSFTLQNMSVHFERLLSTAASFGVTGVEGMREFGAFLQLARRGSGTAEQATTSVERTMSDLISNWQKVKQVTGGFLIFDVGKTRKEGRAVMKNMDVVLKEVIRRTNGDVIKLRKIFGDEAIRAINPLAESFRKHGDFREWEELSRLGGDGSRIMKDFAFWSEQTATKIQDLRTQLSRFANENLAGPIQLLTDALNVLNGHPVITKGGIWALLGLGGVMVGAKFIRGIKDLLGIFRGKGGLGGGIAGGLGGIGGPVPVYVVNGRMSLRDMGMGNRTPKGASRTMRTGGKILRSVGNKIGGLSFLPKAWIARLAGMGGLGGTLAGSVGAAGAGTIAGTVAAGGAIGYGIGTLIDRIGGGLRGKKHVLDDTAFGDKIGESLNRIAAFFGDEGAKQAIEINMRIDEDRRVTTETNNMYTKMHTELLRGKF